MMTRLRIINCLEEYIEQKPKQGSYTHSNEQQKLWVSSVETRLANDWSLSREFYVFILFHVIPKRVIFFEDV